MDHWLRFQNLTADMDVILLVLALHLSWKGDISHEWLYCDGFMFYSDEK